MTVSLLPRAKLRGMLWSGHTYYSSASTFAWYKAAKVARGGILREGLTKLFH